MHRLPGLGAQDVMWEYDAVIDWAHVFGLCGFMVPASEFFWTFDLNSVPSLEFFAFSGRLGARSFLVMK